MDAGRESNVGGVAWTKTLSGFIVLAAGVLCLSASVFGFLEDDKKARAEEERQLRSEARKKITEFRKAFKEAGSEGEKIGAIQALAEVEHGDVAEVLVGLMKAPWAPVRVEAASHLAAYEGDVKISATLLKYGDSEKDESVVIAILDAVGSISACRGVSKLPEFYKKSIPIASRAIEISGDIKSRDIVYPLMKHLEKMERIENVAGVVPSQLGAVRGANMDRKRALLPKAKAALVSITGKSFSTSRHYLDWWKANMKVFRDPEEKAREEEARKEKEKKVFGGKRGEEEVPEEE